MELLKQRRLPLKLVARGKVRDIYEVDDCAWISVRVGVEGVPYAGDARRRTTVGGAVISINIIRM